MNTGNWMVVLVVALALGCGKDNNNNNTTNNGTVNNTSANNTTPGNNTTANNSNNETTPPNNNTSINPRTEPYITQFRYYVEDENALGANREGFTFSVINGEIANQDGFTARLMPDDAEAFETTHLGTDTIDKMRNGWGCRELTGGDMGIADMGAGDMGAGDMGAGDMGAGDMGAGDMGASDMGVDSGPGFVSEANYWFEARIQEGGSDLEVQEITGCVLDMDPDVMVIVEALETLGESYL